MQLTSMWSNNILYEKSYELWIWYEYHCEQYEQKVCKVLDEYGFAKPVTYEECGLISKNARQCLLDMIKKKIEFEEINNIRIETTDWDRAKEDVSRLNYLGVQQEYNRIYKKQ